MRMVIRIVDQLCQEISKFINQFDHHDNGKDDDDDDDDDDDFDDGARVLPQVHYPL